VVGVGTKSASGAADTIIVSTEVDVAGFASGVGDTINVWEQDHLNFATIATVACIWLPLSRPIGIQWIRSSECYISSSVNNTCYCVVHFSRSQPHDQERTV
jgi:hypothetical protein